MFQFFRVSSHLRMGFRPSPAPGLPATVLFSTSEEREFAPFPVAVYVDEPNLPKPLQLGLEIEQLV